MTELTVAVIIPAYNEAETIAAVISSVVNYATPIVVDDGSIDNTGEIADHHVGLAL